MNLLALIQQVARELAIGVPAAVVSSVDPMIVQLYALLNRHGHDMSRQFEWERLNKEYLLTTVAFNLSATTTTGSAIVTMASTTGITTNFGVAGVGIPAFALVQSVDSPTQITMNMPATASRAGVTLTFAQVSYPLPSDWLRQIPQTEWDRSNRWPLLGPKSPQEWQSYKSGIVYAGPRERFRILQNAFVINPPPANALTFAYEYISNAWVIDAGGTYKANLSADTDTWVFDDSLLVAGLKMRWKQAKGLDFSFEAQEYGALLQGIKAQDKSAPTLSLSPVSGSIFLSTGNIPDGNFPG